MKDPPSRSLSMPIMSARLCGRTHASSRVSVQNGWMGSSFKGVWRSSFSAISLFHTSSMPQIYYLKYFWQGFNPATSCHVWTFNLQPFVDMPSSSSKLASTRQRLVPTKRPSRTSSLGARAGNKTATSPQHEHVLAMFMTTVTEISESISGNLPKWSETSQSAC